MWERSVPSSSSKKLWEGRDISIVSGFAISTACYLQPVPPEDRQQRFKVYRPELQPISQGERIRVTRNDRELNIRTGDFATVTRIDDKGALTIRLDRGKEVNLSAKQARHVEHGYPVESDRRVSAERFIVTGDAMEAKALRSVPVHARDLSIHTTAPATQQ